MTLLTDDFRPATGLWSGHAQSLFGVRGRPQVERLSETQASRECGWPPLVTRRGGHVGFVTGSVLRPGFWAEARVMRWLQER